MTTQQRLGSSGGRPLWLRFFSLRSVKLTAAFWVLATIAVFLIVGDGESSPLCVSPTTIMETEAI